MRFALVQTLLEQGFDVEVIRVGPYISDFKVTGKSIRQIINILFVRSMLLAERLGLVSDYLLPWLLLEYFRLRSIVDCDDKIFSTSGGELGTIILGSMLKKKSGSKFIIHFRDPVNYGVDLGVKKNNKFHVGRSHAQIKLMKMADLLVFTAEHHAKKIEKLNTNTPQIVQYTGYIRDKHRKLFDQLVVSDKECTLKPLVNDLEKAESIISDKISKYPDSIVCFYGGSISSAQGITELLELIAHFEAQEIIVFVFSDPSVSYKREGDSNIIFLDLLSVHKYVSLLKKYADIGIVSLNGFYVSHCLPAKIFDIIEHNKFILGYAIKDSEISKVVNRYGRGIVVGQDLNLNAQKEILKKMISSFDKVNINYRSTDDIDWSMSETNRDLIKLLCLRV